MTTYTGDVTVGGPAARRELPGLTVTKVAVGPFDNNAYLLRCRATGDALLVDAANETHRLLAEIGDGGLQCVVTTHRHGDHWQSLADVVSATGATTVAHPDDAGELPVRTARLVRDGDVVAVGDCTLEVIHLVGHTPGSIALLYDAGGELADAPHLFTGDALFPGGVGRTTSPAEFESLINDVEHKVFDRLPDATWFYPGHGRDSTLGAERPSLGQWRARGW